MCFVSFFLYINCMTRSKNVNSKIQKGSNTKKVCNFYEITLMKLMSIILFYYFFFFTLHEFINIYKLKHQVANFCNNKKVRITTRIIIIIIAVVVVVVLVVIIFFSLSLKKSLNSKIKIEKIYGIKF